MQQILLVLPSHYIISRLQLQLLYCCCRHVTFAIGAAAEAFALILVGSAVDRLGRHNIVACGQVLGGGACLACALVKGAMAQAVLAGIGKLGSSGMRAFHSLSVV